MTYVTYNQWHTKLKVDRWWSLGCIGASFNFKEKKGSPYKIMPDVLCEPKIERCVYLVYVVY